MDLATPKELAEMRIAAGLPPMRPDDIWRWARRRGYDPITQQIGRARVLCLPMDQAQALIQEETERQPGGRGAAITIARTPKEAAARHSKTEWQKLIGRCRLQVMEKLIETGLRPELLAVIMGGNEAPGDQGREMGQLDGRSPTM